MSDKATKAAIENLILIGDMMERQFRQLVIRGNLSSRENESADRILRMWNDAAKVWRIVKEPSK